MDYLTLCQRTVQEASVNGVGPTTVLSQTGELKRTVDWVADAWREIQGHKKWSWMWANPTLTMLANTATLAGSIPGVRYEKESFYVPVAGSLGRFITYVPWDEFRLAYPFIQAGPAFNVWTVAPDNSIRVDVKPTANTDFTVERYAMPTVLAGNTDTPGMPDDLHMLIVYKAIVRYANYDEAGSQRSTAIDLISDLETALRDRCLPEWRIGGGLIENDY